MLNNDDALKIPESKRSFWVELSATFRNPALRTALLAKLGMAENLVVADPKVLLVRDVDGYRIGPHPDNPNKAVTLQFYLPRDQSRPHLGTELYRDRRGECVKRMRFAPNHGYAFAVTRQSWHGVPKHDLSAGPRAVLIVYYRA